jgi:hypothetical protein
VQEGRRATSGHGPPGGRGVSTGRPPSKQREGANVRVGGVKRVGPPRASCPGPRHATRTPRVRRPPRHAIGRVLIGCVGIAWWWPRDGLPHWVWVCGEWRSSLPSALVVGSSLLFKATFVCRRRCCTCVSRGPGLCGGLPHPLPRHLDLQTRGCGEGGRARGGSRGMLLPWPRLVGVDTRFGFGS